MLSQARQDVLLPKLDALIEALRAMAHEHAALPMLSRTHGQTASPTTVGKEIANVVARLQRPGEQLAAVSLSGKINGRSEERRAGKEWVRPCRSRGGPYHL